MRKTDKKIFGLKERLNRIKKFILNVWEIMWRPEMAVLPGQLAFFVILSLVPIITLIGYGASFFDISVGTIIKVIEANFGADITQLILPIIGGKSIDLNLLLMLGLMFYVASNGADSIIVASNQIYNIKQSSWIKRRIKALFLTIMIVILVLFVLLVPAFGSKIIDTVDYFNMKSTLANILEIMQGPISWLIMFVFIKIIYTISPDRAQPSSRVNLGAIFTTAGWIIATAIYSNYIKNFAEYKLFYAGLSNIAILMLWIYFLSFIFVIGMSLNSKFELEELEITGTI